MGWNTVTWTRPHPYVDGLPDGTRFYFVHSFAPEPGDDAVGVTEHGRPFAAAVARDNVFATQFHPEKSGEAGLATVRAIREGGGPAVIVIPAIDLRGGRAVRLLRGNPDDETSYADDPVEVAERFQEEGARRLHVVDLDAALERGRQPRGDPRRSAAPS